MLTVETILEDYDDNTKRLVNRLRKIVLDTIPEASEKAWATWNGIGYRHHKAGTFCGIFMTKEGVKIYFMNGRLLKDPDGILQGKHLKMTRFIRFENEKSIKLNSLKKLLKDSVDV